MGDPRKKKALFIINPHSGTRKKDKLPRLLDNYLDHQIIEPEIVYTKFPGEAIDIAGKGLGRYDMVVAVGGDGTINEVARPLIDTEMALGIIPVGSGNGLARHLGIPLNIKKAIQLLNQQQISRIDTIRLNKDSFLNVAGVGFDAHIASLFAESKNRGLLSYGSLALREILKFKSTGFRLVIDGEEKIENAPFLISIANSSQYGNNAHIAPGADISDGLMDICVLQNIPFWYYPILIFHLFNGSMSSSKYYRCWQGKEVYLYLLDNTQNKYIHMDGDPYKLEDTIKMNINPLSLKVICKPV